MQRIRAATAGAVAGGWRRGLVWRWLPEGAVASQCGGLSVAGSSRRAPFGERGPCNVQRGVILDDQISHMGGALALGRVGGWSCGGLLPGMAADVPGGWMGVACMCAGGSRA